MSGMGFRLIAAASLAAIAFSAGWIVRGWSEAADTVGDLEEIVDEQRAQLERLRAITDDAASARIAQQQFHLAQRGRLTEWLLLPGAVDEFRVGDDALWLWNAANAGREAGAAKDGAAGALPPPAAGSGRLRQDAGGEPRDGDGAAGRLRAAPGGAGGVGAAGDRAGEA